jgi:ribosomal protein S18 acetylase RimI-like enzyme
MTPAERNARNLAVSLSFYGKAEERTGVVLITAPVAYSVFNIAVLAAPVPPVAGEFERRVKVAAAHYEELKRPWSFWVCEDDVPKKVARHLEDYFAPHGMHWIAESPGMEAPDLPEPARRLPELEYRPVCNAETRSHFARLVCGCFRIPAAMAGAVYEREQPWQGPLKAWIGYQRGEPVTTAATVDACGVLGLYSVATLEEERRRGLAEAVMRKAIAEARRARATGPLVLQSSASGLRLYRGLGFRSTTRFRVYATPENTAVQGEHRGD